MKLICNFIVLMTFFLVFACVSTGTKISHTAEVNGLGFSDAGTDVRENLARESAIKNLSERINGVGFEYNNKIVSFAPVPDPGDIELIIDKKRELDENILLYQVSSEQGIPYKIDGDLVQMTGTATNKDLVLAIDLAKQDALYNAVQVRYENEEISTKGRLYYTTIHVRYKNKEFTATINFDIVFNEKVKINKQTKATENKNKQNQESEEEKVSEQTESTEQKPEQLATPETAEKKEKKATGEKIIPFSVDVGLGISMGIWPYEPNHILYDLIYTVRMILSIRGVFLANFTYDFNRFIGIGAETGLYAMRMEMSSGIYNTVITALEIPARVIGKFTFGYFQLQPHAGGYFSFNIVNDINISYIYLDFGGKMLIGSPRLVRFYMEGGFLLNTPLGFSNTNYNFARVGMGVVFNLIPAIAKAAGYKTRIDKKEVSK